MKSSQIKYLTIAGATIALGSLYYFFKTQKTSTLIQIKENVIDRDTLLKIIQEFDNEAYPIFQNLAIFAIQIKQQYKGIQDEEIKNYLLEDPVIQQQLIQMDEIVYKKFNITEEQYQYCINVTFKNDEEIQNKSQQFEQDFIKALKGEIPSHQTDIPEFLTYQVTLEIFTQIMQSSAQYIFKCYQKFRQDNTGGNPIQNIEFQKALNPIELEKQKTQILKDFKLDQYPYASSNKIYTHALQKYLKEEKKFEEIFLVIEVHHQKVMAEIFKSNKMTLEKIQTEYQTLLQYELQKIEMSKLLEDEANREFEIKQQYNQMIHDQEEAIQKKSKKYTNLDSINEQIIHDVERIQKNSADFQENSQKQQGDFKENSQKQSEDFKENIKKQSEDFLENIQKQSDDQQNGFNTQLIDQNIISITKLENQLKQEQSINNQDDQQIVESIYQVESQKSNNQEKEINQINDLTQQGIIQSEYLVIQDIKNEQSYEKI